MMLLSAVIGVGAAVLLLTAGYLFGANRAYHTRERLRTKTLTQAEELGVLRRRLSASDEGDEKLRSMIKQLLTPLVQRERLSFDLSHLETAPGHRTDLADVVDQIAEKGNFAAVLLSDDEGWPLAVSSNTRDMDRLAASASLLLLLADRIARDEGPAPLSLMAHDEANMVTLCRIFRVGDQRLSLTAVAAGALLSPTSLDPALVKVSAVLSNWRSLSSDQSTTP